MENSPVQTNRNNSVRIGFSSLNNEYTRNLLENFVRTHWPCVFCISKWLNQFLFSFPMLPTKQKVDYWNIRRLSWLSQWVRSWRAYYCIIFLRQGGMGRNERNPSDLDGMQNGGLEIGRPAKHFGEKCLTWLMWGRETCQCQLVQFFPPKRILNVGGLESNM